MNRIKAFLRRFANPPQPAEEEEAQPATAASSPVALGAYGQGYAGYLQSKAVSDPYYGPALGTVLGNLARQEGDALLRQGELQAKLNAEVEREKARSQRQIAQIGAYGTGNVPFGLFTGEDAVSINPVLGTVGNNIRFAQGAASAQKTGAEALGGLRDAGVKVTPQVADALVFDPVTQTNFGLQMYRPDGHNPSEAVEMRGQDMDLLIARLAAQTRMAIAQATGQDPGDVQVELQLGPGNVITGAAIKGKNPNAVTNRGQELGVFVEQHNRRVRPNRPPLDTRSGLR